MSNNKKKLVLLMALFVSMLAITWIAISQESEFKANNYDNIAGITAIDSSKINSTALAVQRTGKSLRDSIIDFARKQLLVPYKYGSCEPEKGFDCSGFVYFVFQHFEIEIPRSSSGMENSGKMKSLQHVEIGDLLLFTGTDASVRSAGHVGIVYSIDDSISFIHSSSGSANGVTISSLEERHYQKRFLAVRDIISENL